MTKTLAGGMVPAAVISIGKSFGNESAASTAALYPATVAIEERASIACAREMRGMSSMAKSVMPRSIAGSRTAGSSRGRRKPARTAPDFRSS
jgi:hypothetical protein